MTNTRMLGDVAGNSRARKRKEEQREGQTAHEDLSPAAYQVQEDSDGEAAGKKNEAPKKKVDRSLCGDPALRGYHRSAPR